MVNTLISAIKGQLVNKGPDYVDVEITGITLRVSTPTTTMESICDLGG